ncbi:MAG: hypothetical protein KHZ53_11145 [Clostridiales bacterium]|nr:hypothetical protein [Clostridiales bacterium]
MRKTKKILAGILTAAMLMSPATAWAGPSITDKVVVVEDSVGKYIVTDKVEESEVFKTIETEDKEMTDLVKEVNEGKKDIKAFTEKLKAQLETITDEKAKDAIEKVIKEVEEKKLEFLTGFMSLEKEKDAEIEKNKNGKYEVTIHVPILVKDLKDVVILYYNKELKCWEIIEPTEVDFEKQTIKFEVEDFSLISVLANTEDVKTAE